MRQSAALSLALLALACRPAPTAVPESTPPVNETNPDTAPEPADPESPQAAAPAEPDPEPIHHGVTDAELSELCEELGDSFEEPLQACNWLPHSQALADGARVDLIELQVDEHDTYGETLWAYLILRVGDERTIAQLSNSYFVPGEETYYDLGRLKIDGDTVVLPWTASSDIYPNTGNPDEPSGMYTESARFETRCSISNVSCEREMFD